MISEVLYCLDIPIVAISLMACFLVNLPRNSISKEQKFGIRLALILSIIFAVNESIYELINHDLLPKWDDMIYIVDMIYNVLGFAIAATWCQVGFSFLRKVPKFLVRFEIFVDFLGVVLMICQVGFRETDAFITMVNGEAQYGFANDLWSILYCIPAIMLLAVTLYNYFQKTAFILRDRMRPFIIFSLIGVAIGSLATIFDFTYFATSGIFIATTFLIWSLNTSRVTIDEKTGFPNGRQMEKDMDEWLSSGISWSTLAVDMRGRGAIYSEFGRGEHYIINDIIAYALKDAMEEYSCTAYAFTEDKFVINVANNDPEYIEKIRDMVADKIKEYSIQMKVPYVIRMVSDYMCFDGTEGYEVLDVYKAMGNRMRALKEGPKKGRK